MSTCALKSSASPFSRGHSLLEMIIAVMLFATISVGLTVLWIRSSQSMAFSSSRLVAQHVGQAVLEDCIAARYANVDTLAGTGGVTTSELVKGALKTTEYTTVVTVVPDGDLKRVTVEVTWKHNFATNRIMYQTLLAKTG